MKKLIAIMLTLLMIVSLAACGQTPKEDEQNDNNSVVEVGNEEENTSDNEEAKDEEIKDDEKEESKKEETDHKVAEKVEQEVIKPLEEEKKPSEENKEEQPAAPSNATLGTTLLADFKSKAASMNALSIAEALMTNPAIKFMGGAMEVEEGYLSGFDNVEIKGFKEGATFMPMIGSIAFVGYVFELENASDVPSFIAKLEQNANKRWNICVEAEEMVTGSVGNKVFFVMCPKTLEE